MEKLSSNAKLDGIIVVTSTLEAIISTSGLTFTNKNALISNVKPAHYKGLKFVQRREGLWALKLGYINSICLEIIIVSNTRKVVDYTILRKYVLNCIGKAITRMNNSITKTLWISSISEAKDTKLHSISVPVDELIPFGRNLFQELSQVSEFAKSNTLGFKFLFSQLGGSFSLKGTRPSSGKTYIKQFIPQHIDEFVLHIAHDVQIDNYALFLRTDSIIAKRQQLLKNKTWFHVCLLVGAGNLTATLEDDTPYPEISQMQIYSKIFSTFHLKESGTPFKSEEVLAIFFAVFSKKKPRDVKKLISFYKNKVNMIEGYIDNLVSNASSSFQLLRIEFVISNNQAKDKTVEALLESSLKTSELFIKDMKLLDRSQYFTVLLTDLNNYLLKFIKPCLAKINGFVAMCEESCAALNQQSWTVPNFSPCTFYSVLAAQIILAIVFYGKAQSFRKNIRHNNEICRELGLGRRLLQVADVGLKYNGSQHISFVNDRIICVMTQSLFNEYLFKTLLSCTKRDISELIWTFWNEQNHPSSSLAELARFIVDIIYGRGNGFKKWCPGTVNNTKEHLQWQDRIYQVMFVSQFCKFLREEIFNRRETAIDRRDVWFLRFICGDAETPKVVILFDCIAKTIECDLNNQTDFCAYQFQTQSSVHAYLVIPEYYIRRRTAMEKPEKDFENYFMNFILIYAKVYKVISSETSNVDFANTLMEFMTAYPTKLPNNEGFLQANNINALFEVVHLEVLRRKNHRHVRNQ